MSEMSREAREAAKSKVKRLLADPSKPVDASVYTPPGPELGMVQTGERPVTRPRFRAGGSITGGKTTARADRKRRSTGGMTATQYLNRDVHEANDARSGLKHDGGFARGGKPGRKDGGKVHGADCKCAKCSGGRIARASGGGNWIAGATQNKGALHRRLHVPEGEKIPAKKITKAEHSKNPTERKEASLAKTLKGLHKSAGGALDGGTRPIGGRMAKASGGRTSKKGGMNVNIIIAPPKAAGPMPGPMPMPPGGPPRGIPAPPPAAMGPPAGMPPPGVGAPPPMGAPPPQMRKSGGRAYGKSGYPIKDGSGGGMGRLEKVGLA